MKLTQKETQTQVTETEISISHIGYNGIACLLNNPLLVYQASKLDDKLSDEQRGYLRSCIQAASWSLGDILATFTRLVQYNRTGEAIHKVESEEVENAVFELNMLFADLMPLFANLSSDLAYQPPTPANKKAA